MKREIKFRAWDGERMIYLSDLSIGLRKGKRISPYAYFSKDTFGSHVKLGNHEVMQFTGKYDKDGDEIYEGDIIEFDAREWGDNETNIHVVEWNDTSAEWSWGGGSTSDMEWRKVIGNIYENPELIQEP